MNKAFPSNNRHAMMCIGEDGVNKYHDSLAAHKETKIAPNFKQKRISEPFPEQCGPVAKADKTERLRIQLRSKSKRRRRQNNSTSLQFMKLHLTYRKQTYKLNQEMASNSILGQDNYLLRQDLDDMSLERDDLCRRLGDAENEIDRLRFLYSPGLDACEFKEIGPMQSDLLEEDGARVGECHLFGCLGEGGFGQVFLGQVSNASYDQVAIKVMRKERIKSIRHLEQLNIECGVLRRCSHHPNIIRFHGVLHGRNNIYIVMENAESNLHCHIGRQITHQPDFLQQVVLGALRALAYLHHNGISHGDIDPQNILVVKREGGHNGYISSNDIRLCDFGLATVDSKNLQGGLEGGGKRGFVAPELALPGDEHDKYKADMWSLGCTVVALVQPSVLKTWYQHFEKKFTHTEEYMKCITVGLETLQASWICEEGEHTAEGEQLEYDFLLNHLLQMNVRSRISSSAALGHPWFQFNSYPELHEAKVAALASDHGILV